MLKKWLKYSPFITNGDEDEPYDNNTCIKFASAKFLSEPKSFLFTYKIGNL